jgi:hypothetical protein
MSFSFYQSRVSYKSPLRGYAKYVARETISVALAIVNVLAQ